MDDSEDGILPLINIVFLLLIFFMVVGHLAPPDDLVDEPLQSAAAQQPADAADLQPPLTLQVSHDGTLALDGDHLSEEALLEALQAAFSGAEPPSGVQVKADGRTDAVTAIRLIHRLREAQIPSVNLLTLRADITSDRREG
ncbi:MAG: biopolymer transporter ExbD [Spongiibacteraceae bacterium]